MDVSRKFDIFGLRRIIVFGLGCAEGQKAISRSAVTAKFFRSIIAQSNLPAETPNYAKMAHSRYETS